MMLKQRFRVHYRPQMKFREDNVFTLVRHPVPASKKEPVVDLRILLECILVTARVAKRAKVMFSQACVTHSVQLRGGGGGGGRPGHNTSPPGPGYNTSLPPLGPGYNTSLPPPDQVTTPPSQHCDQGTTPPSPLGPGHNTSAPWERGSTPTPRDQGSTPPSLPSPGLCAGGRYASYWNAFLFQDDCSIVFN